MQTEPYTGAGIDARVASQCRGKPHLPLGTYRSLHRGCFAFHGIGIPSPVSHLTAETALATEPVLVVRLEWSHCPIEVRIMLRKYAFLLAFGIAALPALAQSSIARAPAQIIEEHGL